MKKITAIILTMAMALSMFACSSTPKNEVPQVEADATKTADIVIVGAGAAGLSAAIGSQCFFWEAVDQGQFFG